MFVIFKDKEFYEELWENHTSDELKNPIEINLDPINTFDPILLYKKDIHLICIDEEEGIIGKVTFSHTSNNNDILINFDQPSTDSALIIKDVGTIFMLIAKFMIMQKNLIRLPINFIKVF